MKNKGILVALRHERVYDEHLADGLLFATRAGAQAAATVTPDPGPFDEGAGEAAGDPAADEATATPPSPAGHPVGAAGDARMAAASTPGEAAGDSPDSAPVHDRAASDGHGNGAGETPGEAQPDAPASAHVSCRYAASNVRESSGAGDAPLPGLAPDPLDLGGPAVPYKIRRTPLGRRAHGPPPAVCTYAGIVPEPLDAGRFSAWRRRFLEALDTGGVADVPCGTCSACCRSAYFVHIEPDEVETLRRVPVELLAPAPGRPLGHVVLGYDEQGRCPMLDDDRCSIYDHRPRTCRTFDCRVFPAAGLSPAADGKPALAEQAGRWRFAYPTPADWAEHEAVRAAAARLSGARAERTAGEVALAAVSGAASPPGGPGR